MKALVVALNPSIDAEWQVNDLLWEEKNNLLSERRWAGGKGVNVARWLKHLGAKPRLLLPLGGAEGRELARYLCEEKLAAQILPLRESTRVNVIVTTAAGRQMRFNPLGPKLTATDWRRFLGAFRQELRHVDLVLLSGSLPRGLKATAYAELIRIAHTQGVKALLDCDGDALRAAMPARPFLVKPNDHELTLWSGKRLVSERAIAAAAQLMSRQTQGWVLVSRGAKRGLLLNASQRVQAVASPARVKPLNTVGAGDALLAGVAYEILKQTPPVNWLQRGLAVGTAATQLRAGKLPARR